MCVNIRDVSQKAVFPWGLRGAQGCGGLFSRGKSRGWGSPTLGPEGPAGRGALSRGMEVDTWIVLVFVVVPFSARCVCKIVESSGWRGGLESDPGQLMFGWEVQTDSCPVLALSVLLFRGHCWALVSRSKRWICLLLRPAASAAFATVHPSFLLILSQSLASVASDASKIIWSGGFHGGS